MSTTLTGGSDEHLDLVAMDHTGRDRHPAGGEVELFEQMRKTRESEGLSVLAYHQEAVDAA